MMPSFLRCLRFDTRRRFSLMPFADADAACAPVTIAADGAFPSCRRFFRLHCHYAAMPPRRARCRCFTRARHPLCLFDAFTLTPFRQMLLPSLF